jgi:hypothetical protein
VVATSVELDISATRMNGTTARAQPTGRSRGIWTTWSSHSSSGLMVIAIDGRTQSLCPAAMTMTGNARTRRVRRWSRCLRIARCVSLRGWWGAADAFGGADGVDENHPGGDHSDRGQGGSGDAQPAADQPERRERQLDETADLADPL